MDDGEQNGSKTSPTTNGTSSDAERPPSSPSLEAARRIAKSEVKLPPAAVSAVVLAIGTIVLMLQPTGTTSVFVCAALCYSFVFAVGYIHLREGRRLVGWAHVVSAIVVPPAAILIPVAFTVLG